VVNPILPFNISHKIKVFSGYSIIAQITASASLKKYTSHRNLSAPSRKRPYLWAYKSGKRVVYILKNRAKQHKIRLFFKKLV
jgi:hypothetical protein